MESRIYSHYQRNTNKNKSNTKRGTTTKFRNQPQSKGYRKTLKKAIITVTVIKKEPYKKQIFYKTFFYKNIFSRNNSNNYSKTI